MKISPASIIIPTLNEEKYLPLLLDSLRKIAAPLDIIVVDGNSDDGTVRAANGFIPSFFGDSSLRVIHSKDRRISLQRNLGAAEAKHDLLIFCDADVVVPSTEVHAQLLSAFEKGGFVVAAPVLVPTEYGVRIQLTAVFTTAFQRILILFKRPYFGGAYLITTKTIFTHLGGFDSELTLAEDVDYSLRAAKKGPYGLINVRIPVSARRLLKYGYGWIFNSMPAVLSFVRTGRVTPGSVYYPFGEYDKN